MSILADAPFPLAEIAAPDGVFVAVGTVVVLLLTAVAAWFGVFTPASFKGELRFPREQRAGPLWISAVVGVITWVLAAQFGIAFLQRSDLSQRSQAVSQGASPLDNVVDHPMTTAPATTPSAEASLPPIAIVAVNMTAATLAAIGCIVTTRLQSPKLLSQLGIHPSKIPAGVLMGLVGSCVAVPLTIWSSNLSTYLWIHMGQSIQPHDLLKMLSTDQGRMLHVLGLISAAVVTPVFEETLFRGHIQSALLTQTRIPWLAIVLASYLFVLVHPAGWMSGPLMLLAMCFGYAYERTGNLWVPITMHAVFNGVSLALQGA